MRPAQIAVLALMVAAMPQATAASGHGPVFGGATPTLGKGGWSFDQAWMGMRDQTGDHDQMLRSMLGRGITENLQVTISLPIALSSSRGMPMGRMTAMMSNRREMEGIVGWRFHRRDVGEGGRFESTAYVGGAVPLQSQRAGMRTAPSLYAAVATGYASRSHYFWVGGSYQRSMEDAGDRLGDVKSYSVVYGYRPKALRLDYPKPDLRFFVETVGELTGKPRHGAQTMPDMGGHVILTGPTTLLLYKAYGISGGVLFPIYQKTNGNQPRERYRFAVNASYFFWGK